MRFVVVIFGTRLGLEKPKKPERVRFDPSEPAIDPMDAIARAARRKHARDAKRERKASAARGAPASRARTEQEVRRALMLSSLGDADSDLRQYLRIIPAGAVLLGSMWAASEIPAIARMTAHGWSKAVLVVIVLALVVATFALCSFVLARWQLNRIHRVGHGFDVAHYLEILSQVRSRGTLRVSLRCRVPWHHKQQKTTIDAIAMWDRDVEAHWLDEHVLELRTKQLFTMSETIGDESMMAGRKSFTNRPIHDAFMRIVHRVVPKIHAANPIDAIEVAVDGEVYPYDTDPEAKHRAW